MRLMTPDETSPRLRSLPLGSLERTHELNEQLRILLLLNPRIDSGLCEIREASKQCSHVENQKLESRRDDIDQSNTYNIVLYPILLQPFGIANQSLRAQAISRHSYFSLMLGFFYGPSRPPLFASSYKTVPARNKGCVHYLLLASTYRAI